ncbi:unnamed protein product [Gongylonema pulchrum]|uniref:Exocyst complex component Sec10 n=1 Tax=Gongylonema pulchrum TaxID=637853 RepID=A0A183DVH9_9BILA|nr:unnamed protein product [Gongylonema pulchrum]
MKADIEDGPAAQARRAERRASLKLLEEHAEGMRSLVDWIFGAGEKWLLTLHEIGESHDDAKQLLKEHNELEAKSREVEAQSRDLVALGRELEREFPKHAAALQQSTERVEQVTRAFRARVARQKEIAQRSVCFYQMLTEVRLLLFPEPFSRGTDLLLESLCTEVKATDISSAEMERNAVEAKVDEMGYFTVISKSSILTV